MKSRWPSSKVHRMHDDEAGRVRALAEILREYDLDALRVRVGEAEYELVAREPAPAGTIVMAPGTNGVSAAPAAATSGESVAAGAGPPANVKRVTAPVVGVYYSAPSPGSDPFITVGARVVPGQVLCILEAMKLMNEITSEFAGVVSRVLPENGQLVSLGDDLVWIEP
jgi:acetyl-CoA carboxylase biotin carboxyl carrier protein